MSRVAEALDALSIPYFITGSCASISYGEPRLTNDIDIVADISAKDIPSLLGYFPLPEFYLSEDAIREAIATRGQFNIIHPTSGLKVDIIIRKGSEYDGLQFERCQRIPLSKNKTANFASPEDVIVMKMEYYRMGGSEKHLRDITGMMKISGKTIDCQYISLWAKRFGLAEIWEAILKRIAE